MFTDQDLGLLSSTVLIPSDPKIIDGQVTEVHIYSFYGDYILGNHNAGYVFHDQYTNSLLIDVKKVFQEANILKGSYLVAINLFQSIWGEYGSEPVILREISPDRTELHLKVDKRFEGDLGAFSTKVLDYKLNDFLNNVVINFGFNQIQKITNIRIEGSDIFIKLYQPLFDEIDIKSRAWFQFEVIDPYIDTIILTQPLSQGKLNYLQGPNFDIDTSLYSGETTDFKNWNELLDANLPTQQRIIENALSGSGIKLNIDYTSLENFIFYSSAEERVRNFNYKVSKIEEYSSSIAILLNTTASNTTFISSSIDINQRRIDELTSNFDGWEKWLYYEPTSSIFSHDVSGSITPMPKRIFSGSWKVHPLSSSIVQTWYQNLLTSASAYDQDNQNRLWWSIPEHIIMQNGNSDFVTFVDMVGHHFDELYGYVNALTKIHERDEHPQRGTPNELLWHVAKSFGWHLQNTKQLADLWKYHLGTNNQGQFEETGSLFSLTGATQTHQIWRRIVNNLPYLLKTKGTQRSVKALLSIYGIPQTLISIKEYGGPSPVTDLPTLIEDRFIYKLKLSGSQWIELPRRVIPPSSGSWNGFTRVPDTIEFRFNTEFSSSVSQSLWSIEDGTDRNRVLSNLELVHVRAQTQTSSYSGSTAYGYLRLTQAQLSGSTYISSSVQTNYLPLFDDDSWTVRIYTPEPLVDTKKSGSIYLEVKRANDSLFGRIAHSGSLTWSGSFNVASAWGGLSGSALSPHYILLGGTTGSRSSRFVGNIDGYKEYFDLYSETTFNHHVLNPQAYYTNNETGSFYTLFRYFPLGTDAQRWNHSSGNYTQVSSSQPNRIASFDTTASFKGFSGSQANHYTSTNETHYVYAASLGGNVLRSEKVRLEDISLIRDLSPTNRSEKGAFDRKGFDSNRLAIVFSPTDQINNEIFNHSGPVNLDSWIGDPEYEFEEGYSELRRYGNQYFQKYQQPYNINSLIRLLALYDFTFFDQVKQLIPGRADAILGVLIEPDMLHKQKVIITKKPEISNPQYDLNLPRLIPSQSSDYLTYEGSASIQPQIESRYKYITGSIKRVVDFSGSSLYHTSSRGYPNAIIDGFKNKYSGSQSPTQSYIDGRKLNCCYSKVIYHYSSSGQYANQYEKQWYTAVSMSYGWYYSRSLECTSYQYQESCAVENRKRFYGSRLEGPGINIPSPDTIDGGPVITVWETNPNSIIVEDSPLGGRLIVR